MTEAPVPNPTPEARATAVAYAALFEPDHVPDPDKFDAVIYGVSPRMLADAVLPTVIESLGALELVRDYVVAARTYTSPECDECEIMGPLLARADVLLSSAEMAVGPFANALPCVNAISRACRDVIAERRRQVEDEGYDAAHDDAHDRGEIADAAACYAYAAGAPAGSVDHDFPPSGWPWADAWWKPTTARRDMVKAAALCIAEIDRLDRAEAAAIAAKPLDLASRAADDEGAS